MGTNCIKCFCKAANPKVERPNCQKSNTRTLICYCFMEYQVKRKWKELWPLNLTKSFNINVGDLITVVSLSTMHRADIPTVNRTLFGCFINILYGTVPVFLQDCPTVFLKVGLKLTVFLLVIVHYFSSLPLDFLPGCDVLMPSC